MPRSKISRHDNAERISDEDKWDVDEDIAFVVDAGVTTVKQRTNMRALRLYDRYQERRRLRKLLGDDFDC